MYIYRHQPSASAGQLSGAQTARGNPDQRMFYGRLLRPQMVAAGEPKTNFTKRRSNMKKLTRQIGRFIREEDGATAIEYGLIAALLSVVIIGSVKLTGTNLDAVFNKVAVALQ